MVKRWIPLIPLRERTKYNQTLDWVDAGLLAKYKTLGACQAEMKRQSAGVMACASGELVYLFYSAMYRDDQEMYNLARTSLENLISVTDESSTGSFAAGVPGLLWTLYHLENTDMVPGAGNMIDDEVINHYCKLAIDQIAEGNFDLMYGGLGMALALLQSEKRTKNQDDYLAEMVSTLYRIAQFNGNTALFYDKKDPEKPNERTVSFGMAHGLPGIIAVLSKIYKLGIEIDKCKELIEKSINFILSKKQENKFNCLFPQIYNIGSIGNVNGYGRVAWCYGDIDLVFALLHAYGALNNINYKEEADFIINYIVTHNEVNSQYTFDGSFCHGACGNGHMFNRLYNYTGNQSLAAASQYWFSKVCDRIKYENNALTISVKLNNKPTWSNETNVIMGTAGLGLTLLSAIAEVTPDWDDMFLLRI